MITLDDIIAHRKGVCGGYLQRRQGSNPLDPTTWITQIDDEKSTQKIRKKVQITLANCQELIVFYK